MYESRNNRTKVRTKPRVTKHAKYEVESSSDDSYDSDEKPMIMPKIFITQNKNKNKGGVGPLKYLGPGLYR